jgi:nickel-dependent lactate racemase
MRDFCGVIGELVAGRWQDPKTGQKRTVPVESIVIADTLEGSESTLIEHVHPGKAIAVVSDERTRAVLGERILRALQPLGKVSEFVWQRPRITPDGIEELAKGTQDAEVLVAVGSGHHRQREIWDLFDSTGVFDFRDVAYECLHHTHSIGIV